MNRLAITSVFLLFLIVPQAWGATSQNPNPYRQTIWNNVTDTYHTLGQNPYQKKATLKKLHNARTRARIKSMTAANMAKVKARRQAWQKSQNDQ